MATRPVGTVYPKARGRQIQVLNIVAYDIIEAIVQIKFCDRDEKWPKTEKEQHGYVWKAVRKYADQVIKHHKY